MAYTGGGRDRTPERETTSGLRRARKAREREPEQGGPQGRQKAGKAEKAKSLDLVANLVGQGEDQGQRA